MQIGFNNDVEYRGKTFHIQTEDRGLPAAQIETQIFHAGAILDTAIISYQKIIDSEPEGDGRIQKIRAFMTAAHRNFYKKLKAGEYDGFVGLEPVGAAAAEEAEDFKPGQDRVPAAALDLEKNPEAFAVAHEMGESVDISKLKEHLAGAGAGDESSGVEEEASPTMVATPETIGKKLASDTGAGVLKRAPSVSGPISAPLSMTTAPSASIIDFPPTGARAWTGCVAPKEDLSLVPLVEAFLAS